MVSVHYSRVFVNSPMASASQVLVNGINVFGGLSERPQAAPENLITRNVGNNAYQNCFQFQDMLGTYRNEANLMYGILMMSEKMRMVMVTKIRIPVKPMTADSQKQLTTYERALAAYEIATLIRYTTDAVYLKTKLPRNVISGTIEGVQIGGNKYDRIQRAILNSVLVRMKLGRCLSNYPGTIIPKPNQFNQECFDSYGLTPYVLDRSLALLDTYKDPTEGEQNRYELVKTFIPHNRMELLVGNYTINGALVGAVNMNVSQDEVPMKTWCKLWHPNIALLHIYNDPLYPVPNGSIYSINSKTLLAFNFWIPFIMPSGMAYFSKLYGYVNGNVPYEPLTSAICDEPYYVENTLDTFKPSAKIGWTPNLIIQVNNPNNLSFECWK